MIFEYLQEIKKKKKKKKRHLYILSGQIDSTRCKPYLLL